MHRINRITRSIWLATALAGTWHSLPALAQEQTPAAEQDTAPTLKSVTVTAQRREESVQDIANAVSAVSGETLGQTGTDYIGKAIQFVPNAQANNPDGDARPRWYIRGVGTGDQGAATVFPVGVYVDDVYLNAPLAGGDPLFDLDRIEILRGPQGTLYGKNTTGGAVNILTKKPTFENDGYATLGYGSKNEKIVNGALGGTLVEDRLAARVSLYSKERDGFIKNVYDDKDYDRVDNKAVRLQFLAKFNPDLTALWSLHDSQTRGTAAGLLPVGRFPWLGGYSRSNPDRRYIDSNVDNKSKIEHAGTSLTLNYDLGDYRLTSISAYDETKQRAIGDDDLSPVESGRSYTNNRWRQYSQEFRIASPTSETLRWILGTHVFHEDLQSAGATSALPDAGASEASYTGTSFDHKNTSYALFGNLAYDFTDQFTVTGGLRWTREKKDIDLDLVQTTGSNFSDDWWDAGSLQNPVDVTGAGITTNGNARRNKTWSAVTYDLTPEYRINDNLRVYARYAKGFRSGAFNTGLSSSLEQLSTVQPETLNSYELGLKSEWLNGRVHANANVFYYDYKDMQVSATTTTTSGSLVSLLTNGAEGKARGAEFELEAQATDNLHLQLAASLFSSEFTGDLWKGNSFIRAPRHTYALGADYRFALDIPGSLVLGGDLRYQSKEYFISAYQQSQWTWLNQGGYTVSNAHLSYTTADEKYNITGFVNNLTDKHYQTHGLSLNRGSAPYWAAFGDPRTAGVTVTAKF
ncbi:TonB-dependent receptor [Pseudomonas sp. MF6755]|uniref:TonB-dependent receptor n=1 Tax=Pseudomonas sp. MF6755 TaxID=2797530 RepID=UPI0018E71F87|nr:TonB-dependent receptor [Pseudomonas sp. MF6755]MBJ2285280.1 TonB-dependent receptor [Pseudomonas sp. MF6755]